MSCSHEDRPQSDCLNLSKGSVWCRVELLQKVHATNRQLQETQMQTQQTRRIGRRDRGSSNEQIQDQGLRDSNIELITIILEALEKEHEYL